MNVWRKTTVRHLLNGKQVRKGTAGAKTKTVESKRFYGTLRMADGTRKQIPLCEERDTAETMLRKQQTEEDKNRALGITSQDRQRLHPISKHVDDYESHLRSKQSTESYVRLHISRLRAILTATKTATIGDLDSGKINRVLSKWREKGPLPSRKGRKRQSISVQTSNHYVRACRGFSRWLWTAKRTADDVLRNLSPLNAKADRLHVRRSLTPDELRLLISATLNGNTLRFGSERMSPKDRAMLYTVAAYTGLRASELASLTRSSFDLSAKTVTVLAAYSKRRRDDVLPLHLSLVERLTTWLETKADGQPLWPGPWASDRRGAAMMRYDLKNSGIDYKDDGGRFADFHALRHTFISQMARSGVHPSKAKELARHSTITLTMDVYSHVETEELRKALDTLPGF